MGGEREISREEIERHWLSVQAAEGLIHALTIDVSQPFICTETIMRSTDSQPAIPVEVEIGRINNPKQRDYLRKIGIEAYKKDLIALGEPEMVEAIITKGAEIIVWEEHPNSQEY